MHVKFTKHMVLWWMWVMILAWCTVAEFAHAYTPKMNLILKETDRICISEVTICNWWTRAIFLMAWAEWPGHCINLLQFILKSRLIVSSRCLIHELIHWCWGGGGWLLSLPHAGVIYCSLWMLVFTPNFPTAKTQFSSFCLWNIFHRRLCHKEPFSELDSNKKASNNLFK